MAFDSRPRPVRRRVSWLTALAMLVMAAGLWLAGPAAAYVPPPRLQVAEARIAAAALSAPAEELPDEDVEPVAAVAAAAPVVVAPPAVPVPAVSPAVAGPRAPPHS